MSRPCLETKDLWFGYGAEAHAESRTCALRGVSFEIQPGDFVALIGQNGSGKSTLAKHFNGLLRPDKGEVSLHGRVIGDTPVSELARSVGYVFQNPDHQIFSPTVREEIAAGPVNLGWSEADVRARVDDALSSFDLGAYADHPPAVLSFGLRRKVAVAAVFAMQTAVLVLDEPTAGLDARHTAALMERIEARRAGGATIIVITHDMALVAEHAPRCMVLNRGQLVAYDDTRSVFEKAQLLHDAHLELPQITRLGRRMAQPGMPDVVLLVGEFCEAFAGIRDGASGR